MRIGINAYGLSTASGGVSNHLGNLLRLWPERFSDDRILVYCGEENRLHWEAFALGENVRIESSITQEEIAGRTEDWDVFFCPAGLLWPRDLRSPTVVAIADVQERFFPERFEPTDLAYRLQRYDASLKLADRVVTVSDFSRESLVRVLGVPRGKVDRVYHCPDALPENASRPEGLPESGFEKFAFYPANNWKHKNHGRLIEALAIARERGVAIPLVLSGNYSDSGYDILGASEKNRVEGLVCHLGFASREEISWLYRHAECLAFASTFEGFGIPIVEARQMGLTVLRGNHSSLPEVGTENDVVTDTDSAESIAAGLMAIWTDAAKSGMTRDSLGERFSPEAFVEGHRAAFEKAIDGYRPWRTQWRRLWVRWFHGRPRNEITRRERTEAAKLLKEAIGG